MSQTINVNGQSINYPETGDTNWGDEATEFAVQTSAALGKLGLASGTTVDIPGTIDVTGNTTLDANLTVGGNASVTGNTTLTGNITVNGNSNLGNGTSDTTAITGILNVDSGVLFVDPTTNKVGINDATPSVELDVNGAVAISGTLGVTGDVAINTNKFNVTASTGNTTIAGTLGVTSDITTSGILTASNSTNVTTAPPITFTGDTNTGIGHSASDTLDYVTGGVSRSRLNSTGQQSSVIPDLSGSNTTLFNEYKCRAWVNFNGTTASPSTIRGSGNVSSVTKNGTGDYTINFTTNMPDVNYVFLGTQQFDVSAAVSPSGFIGLRASLGTVTLKSVSQYRIVTTNFNGTLTDASEISTAAFR